MVDVEPDFFGINCVTCTWKPKTTESNLLAEIKWRDAVSVAEREQLVEQSGIRYSELHRF